MDPKQAHEAAQQLDPDWRPYIGGDDDELADADFRPETVSPGSWEAHMPIIELTDEPEHQASFEQLQRDLQREFVDELWRWLLECRTCGEPHAFEPFEANSTQLTGRWTPADREYRPRLHPSIVDGLRAEHAQTREA